MEGSNDKEKMKIKSRIVKEVAERFFSGSEFELEYDDHFHDIVEMRYRGGVFIKKHGKPFAAIHYGPDDIKMTYGNTSYNTLFAEVGKAIRELEDEFEDR